MIGISTGLRRRWGAFLRVLPDSVSNRLRSREYHYSPADLPDPLRVPHATRRLYVAPVNFAGQGFLIARSAETLGSTGAVSMQFSRKDDFGFRVDDRVDVNVFRFSRTWQRERFTQVAQGFSHVLVEAGRPIFGTLFGADPGREIAALLQRGVRVGLIAHGSDIRDPDRHRLEDEWSPFRDEDWARLPELRRKARAAQELFASANAPVFAMTPDLLLDWPSATWLPLIVDVERWRTADPALLRRRPKVVHVPSNAFVKGSHLIEPTMARLHEEGLIEYRRVSGVSASEMPSIYQEADLVLDQFRIGSYGVAACEAMAAGRLVVAHVKDQVRDHVRTATGMDLPILQATPATLEAVIRSVVEDPQAARRFAARGPGFVDQVHDGGLSAAALGGFLESTAQSAT